MLPGGQLLALIIPSLTETMAGTYYCSASYANTELIESSVDIQTFGKFLFFYFGFKLILYLTHENYKYNERNIF